MTKSSESFFDQKPKNIKEMAETEVRMENIVLALLAHVDRGKTSLSEALLYESGRISEKGRVDHGDSVLDKDSLERKKGITIYAKSVYFTKENKRFFLLDTPGHQEFSSEMERCLAVMDYGILLIDGNDGIQKRELHLFERAREKGIPLFLVVNKMDLFQGDREALLREIQEAFSCEGIISSLQGECSFRTKGSSREEGGYRTEGSSVRGLSGLSGKSCLIIRRGNRGVSGKWTASP